MNQVAEKPVAFEVGGKTYTMHFGMNELCAVERALDAAFGTIVERMKRKQGRVGDMIALFHASLQRDHPDVTNTQAAEMAGALGLDKMGDLVATAIERSPIFRGEPEPPVAKKRGK